GGGGVAGDDKTGDELLSEHSRQYRGQIETTHHSRPGPRRQLRRRRLSRSHGLATGSVSWLSAAAALSTAAGDAGTNSIRSPGWHRRAVQMASSVDKRTARALPVLRTDRLASVIPILSDNSVRVMRRSWSMSSSLTMIDIR